MPTFTKRCVLAVCLSRTERSFPHLIREQLYYLEALALPKASTKLYRFATFQPHHLDSQDRFCSLLLNFFKFLREFFTKRPRKSWTQVNKKATGTGPDIQKSLRLAQRMKHAYAPRTYFLHVFVIFVHVQFNERSLGSLVSRFKIKDRLITYAFMD